jgi:deazaflavin-dependent oxidoreductase (nitroreductase family)
MPIGLYRLGLGWLLGHQFLLLTHAGRRTGRVRQTALKVLRYDPATGESVVASAWGPGADWYRNILSRPALVVQTASDHYAPEQRLLGHEEAYAVFDDWAQRQRWFARLMLSQIGVSWEVPEAERRSLVSRFPFVGFRPRDDLRRVQRAPDTFLDAERRAS